MRQFGTCEIFIEVVDTEMSILETFETFGSRDLVILESKSFFEAFSHTLRTLQEMRRFPFERIIRGDPQYSVQPPAYLYDQENLDFDDFQLLRANSRDSRPNLLARKDPLRRCFSKQENYFQSNGYFLNQLIYQ